MKEPTIPATNLKLSQQSIREEIDAAIRSVCEHRGFVLGPEVQKLEREVARLQQCSFGIGCASGTDALLLSLLALGIKSGMSVLVPAFTFFSTGCSVMRSGAHVVFVDIEPRTFNMSATSAKEALRKQPAGLVAKAMITVHLYGQCADMRGLLDLARRHGLQVVEDAAQAILASHGGRAAGSFGACGCFSFYPTKNLGGFGDGGMITTNDAELAERLRLLRNHGSQDKVTYTSLGMNSRLDTLQAAVLLVKLRHLEEWTRLRQQKAATYRQAFLEAGLSNAEAVYPTREEPIVLPYVAPGAEHVYHQFTVRAWRRDELAKDLSAHGIETAIYYPVPLHQQPAFAALKAAQSALPESERAAKEVLSLPIYPELTEGQQDRVVRQIRKFYFS